jgi:tetratricopeptide (TPR) repeat protein
MMYECRDVAFRLLAVMGLLLCVWFVFSCGQPRKEIAQLLAQAEAAVEQRPDSALLYLDAIRSPAGLPQEQRHHYHLLRIQAKDKTGQDICADTVIVQAKEYFLQSKDFPKATLAAFYEGCVFGKDNRRALQAFLEAETMAAHIPDSKRKGLIQYNIGGLYYTNRTEYDRAVACLGKAAGYFRQSGDTTYQMEALKLRGICFLLVQQPDSAFLCQQKALDIAVAQKDTLNEAFILRNISSIYGVKGDYPQAKAYALKAMNKGDRDTLKALLNMAYIHNDAREYDSAAGYARRIIQRCSSDSTQVISASVYYLLADIAKQKKDYRKALDYTHAYYTLVDKMNRKQKEHSITGVREKYELELLQAEKQLVDIRTSQKILAVFLVATALIIAVLVLIIGYLSYKKRFVRAKEENERLYRMRIDLVKKAGLIEHAVKTTLKDETVVNKLGDKIYKSLYENSVWAALYAILNERHKGAMERLRQQLPLPEQDFQICCFTYAGFSDKEIAACMYLSPNTIKAKKNTIRKQLKVAERGSIERFMVQKLHDEMI